MSFDWMRQGNIYKYPYFCAEPHGMGIIIINECHTCGAIFYDYSQVPGIGVTISNFCIKHKDAVSR